MCGTGRADTLSTMSLGRLEVGAQQLATLRGRRCEFAQQLAVVRVVAVTVAVPLDRVIDGPGPSSVAIFEVMSATI
jgi:hypothetical protein